jgi:hypothetical protein
MLALTTLTLKLPLSAHATLDSVGVRHRVVGARLGSVTGTSRTRTPASSKSTTPLQSRLQPCSGWHATTHAAARSRAEAPGHRGQCRQACSRRMQPRSHAIPVASSRQAPGSHYRLAGMRRLGHPHPADQPGACPAPRMAHYRVYLPPGKRGVSTHDHDSKPPPPRHCDARQLLSRSPRAAPRSWIFPPLSAGSDPQSCARPSPGRCRRPLSQRLLPPPRPEV